MTKITISKSILLSLLCVAVTNIQAQRLPTVQKESVLAPAGIKIDGKANEWQNQFKAYNKSTSIFYTMANDNNNLYLIIQATDSHTIQKIFSGGITFTIENLAGDKKSVPLSITYPLMSASDQGHALQSILDTSVKVTNDVLHNANQALEAGSKEARITGCEGITDPLISVYNEYGIKVAALFNTKRAYTYELAIPIKYFNRSVDNTGTLKYNIKLNGMNASNVHGMLNGKPIDASNSEQALALASQLGSGSGATKLMDLISATDLSGTYVLAK